jgi:hypothetical protein
MGERSAWKAFRGSLRRKRNVRKLLVVASLVAALSCGALHWLRGASGPLADGASSRVESALAATAPVLPGVASFDTASRVAAAEYSSGSPLLSIEGEDSLSVPAKPRVRRRISSIRGQLAAPPKAFRAPQAFLPVEGSQPAAIPTTLARWILSRTTATSST